MLRCLAMLTICGLIGCVPSPAPPPAPTIETEPASTPAAADSGGEDGTNPAGFESPEAVFAEIQRAADAGEWRGFVDCMTAESQVLVAAMATEAAYFGGDEMAVLLTVLEKHGVTPSATPYDDTTEVADLPAFIADLCAAIAESDLGELSGGPTEWAKAELTRLSRQEEQAVATLTYAGHGPSDNELIAFVRKESGWLADLSVHMPVVDELSLPETTLIEGLSTRVRVSTRRPSNADRSLPLELPEGTLYVTLYLTGETMPGVYEFGELELVAAADDTGEELELAAPVQDVYGRGIEEELVSLDSMYELPRYGDTLIFYLVLTEPAEGANRLSTLDVTVKLKVGTSLVVENVMESIGDPIDLQELADIGELSFHIWDGGIEGDWAVAELRGPMGLLISMSLLDGDGRAVGMGGSAFSNGWSFGFQTDSELPEDLQMRVTLGDAESIQNVPLNFEDLEW